jgi:hypothetical protein
MQYLYKPTFVTPEDQIEQLREQLKQAEEQYMRLWNQHKLLRLSYRFLKIAKKNNNSSMPARALNENFQSLLYGMGRGVPLEFQKPVQKRKSK